MGRQRTRWQAARHYLTPVADGGLAIAGTPPITFRTAPLPAGVELQLWEDCGCDYEPPPADDFPGRPTGRAGDPAWAEWTEDPPREDSTKRSLRYALSDPRNHSDGGLLGPNYYGLAHFHSGDARLEAPGMTDLLIWTPLPVPNEAWELKRMGEVPTLPQAHHMTTLAAAGFTVRTVRPCCLLSGDADRWLAALSGKAPTLSPWAPGLDPAGREQARQRAARSAYTAAAPAGPAPVKVDRSISTARPRPVVAPPGLPVPDDEPGLACAYLLPMPDDRRDAERRALEAWLRRLGFAAVDVPWPMRIVVGERLVAVRVNTGEPGRPRPRCWRALPLQDPFPDHLVAPLGGDTIGAPSMTAAQHLIADAVPSRHLT